MPPDVAAVAVLAVEVEAVAVSVDCCCFNPDGGGGKYENSSTGKRSRRLFAKSSAMEEGEGIDILMLFHA